MKALFDIGNSRLKWAWFDTRPGANRPLQHVGDASHVAATFTEIAALNWESLPVPEQVIVSSVAAERHWQSLREACSRHWQLEPVRLTSVASQCGIENVYDKPEELGSDRWAAMIAAHQLFATDLCVIDCGTAMTVDFLSAHGQHLGGYIIPGLALMQQSLVQGTEAIQLSSAQLINTADGNINPGRSTAECIHHGSLLAAVSMIKISCEKMEANTGLSFHCLLTGGNAELLDAFIENAQYEPHLVLLGLAQVATENSV